MSNEITQEKMDKFLDDVIYTNFCTPEKNITDDALRQKYFPNVNTEDIKKFIKIINKKNEMFFATVVLRPH